MKKIVILVLVVCLAAGFFSACEPEREVGKKDITVIIDLSAYEGEINVDEGVMGYTDKVKKISHTTEKGNLEEVLAELVEGKKLTYEAKNDAGFGIFIEKIDNVKHDDFYYAIYSDVDDQAVTTRTVDGKTLYYSNVGANSLAIKDGKTYLIYFEKWNNN